MFHGTPMSPWPVTAGHLLTISGSLTVNALSKPFYRFDRTLCSTGPLCSLFLWFFVLTVSVVLCAHCSSSFLYPLFPWSSVPSVPLVLCAHCSSGPLVLRCSGPLYSEFLWSSVLLILFTHCSSGSLYSLFQWSFVPIVPLVFCTHCSLGPLYPLFHWFPVPTVPPVLCAHYSSSFLYLQFF